MLEAGVGGGCVPPCTLEIERALVELARDTLASRDRGGIETEGEGFRDRHLREKEGMREPTFDARPLKGEASPRWRFAMGLRG